LAPLFGGWFAADGSNPYVAFNSSQTIARAGGAGAPSAATYDGADRLSTFTHDFASGANDVTWGFGYSAGNQAVSRTSTNDAYSFAVSTI
jgi:hypothetical protein